VSAADDRRRSIDETAPPVERARAALRIAEDYGALTDDERLDFMVRGVELGKLQSAYLRHAQTCALVAIAEQLSRIGDLLADRLPLGL
jgi:hypothetical protein